MEIGSFFELELPKGREYYTGSELARLNSGRAAIWHALRVMGCKTVWLPYYQCETVRNFLIKKNIRLKYYHINFDFTPQDLRPVEGEAVLFVNYFGVMGGARMSALGAGYKNVIFDNAQAFFSAPEAGSLSIYSPRKFFGVPDGAYVIGEGADSFCGEYERDCSSDASLFLLTRIEYGCGGRAYEARMRNEKRIDASDVKRMSALTRAILDGTDYEDIKRKRRENYAYACGLFDAINRLNASRYLTPDCVPMVYPLVVEDESLFSRLLEAGHFQGRWWSYLKDEMSENSFEHYLSRYLVPISIDQRYGREELKYIREAVG